MTKLSQHIVRPLPSYFCTILIFYVATLFNPCLPLSTGQDAANGQWRVTSVTEISPDQSSLQELDPNGASGGRINGLALAPGDKIAYAASEWGGLFKSDDGGRTWRHLDNHLPSATWRVAVDPENSDHVYVTSFYDGRVSSFAGINISEDGGKTWKHPQSTRPPARFCRTAVAETELTAFGISTNPDDASFVYVGTTCGLAISPDRGKTWSFVDPSPNDPADSVWDVLAQKNGIIDLCGDDGHARSRNGGKTWILTNSLPSGRCSLAVSPDEPDVLFAVVGTQPYESDDAGKHWSKLTNPQPQGRIPFVAVNKRKGSTFDLWFGDVTLYRIPCSTPTPGTSGAGPRCPAASTTWVGPFTSSAGGHDDTAGIVFSRAEQSDNCPILFSSDGGVYLNTVTKAPNCHDPKWTQPQITPHGLWLFSMDGATEASPSNEDLYIGNQDDGTFGTRNALAQQPTWINSDCCDSFVSSASPLNILYASCCYEPGRYNRLFLRKPGLVGGGEINTYPAGELPGWESHIVAQFGMNKYAVITTEGIFITQNITARTVRWTRIGESTTPGSPCGLYVSTLKQSTPVFFVQAGNCDGRGPSAIYRLDGTASSGTWRQVNTPDNKGGFGVFAVDLHNPLRILASYIRNSEPIVSMISTTDGGSSWTSDTGLDQLMTQSGTFEYKTTIGPTDFTSFNGYPQPTLVAFDPGNQDIVIAAGADSGLFLSFDRGQHWEIVPTNGRSVCRPRAVRFAHLSPLTETIFVGSQGSGVWKVNLAK